VWSLRDLILQQNLLQRNLHVFSPELASDTPAHYQMIRSPVNSPAVVSISRNG
jgi:hypothetical protein